MQKMPTKVTIAAIDRDGGYVGHKRHEDVMGKLLEMEDVRGVVRVMRKTKGDHTLWCFFGDGSKMRVLRTGKPEGFLDVEGSIFDAPTRGKSHPSGYMSTHCFLTCPELGKGRPNFVDLVESVL